MWWQEEGPISIGVGITVECFFFFFFASSIISLMFWPGIEPGNTLAQRGIEPRFSLFNYDRITQHFDHSAAEADESSGPNLNWYPKPQNLCHHGIPWNISVVVVLPNGQVKMIWRYVVTGGRANFNWCWNNCRMVFASSIISLMFWPGIEPGNMWVPHQNVNKIASQWRTHAPPQRFLYLR